MLYNKTAYYWIQQMPEPYYSVAIKHTRAIKLDPYRSFSKFSSFLTIAFNWKQAHLVKGETAIKSYEDWNHLLNNFNTLKVVPKDGRCINCNCLKKTHKGYTLKCSFGTTTYRTFQEVEEQDGLMKALSVIDNEINKI